MATKRASLADRENLTPTRPRDLLFQPTGQPTSSKIDISEFDSAKKSRKTYFISHLLIEALKIYSFKQRTLLQTSLNKILVEALPREVLEEAKKNLDGTLDGLDEIIEQIKNEK